MIYLIETTYYNKDNSKIVDLLKIGYTSDDSLSKRLSLYKLHNPLCKLLFTIPNGTEEDEKKLHIKFKKFLYPDYGREWFVYDEEIINFFSSHLTYELLQQDINEIELLHGNTYVKSGYMKSVIDQIYKSKVNSKELTLDQAVTELHHTLKDLKGCSSFEKFWEYVHTKFNITEEEVSVYAPDSSLTSTEAVKFLIKFDSYTQFTDKMKLLCESVLSDEEINSILNLIPIDYKNYYTVLGPNRIKSLSYQRSKLKIEYNKLKGDQSNSSKLTEIIISTFIVGNRYTKVFIKQKLTEIYNTLGIHSSPKAVDLENYFEVKKVQITNKDTGKKDHGYEIISKKEL